MRAKKLLDEVRDFTLEALEWLVEVLQPWNAEEFCLRCGVPPLQLETDWSSGLQSLREDAEHLDAAQFASRLAAVIDSLVEAIEAAQDSDSDWVALDIARPLITNVLLGVLQKRYEETVRIPLLVTDWDAPYAKILHTLFVVLLLTDERLKESVRHTTIAKRWAVLYDAEALDGLKERETQLGIFAALGAFGGDVFLRRAWGRFAMWTEHWKPMIQLGFDTRVAAPSEELAAARRAVALLYGKTHRPLGQADYQRFDDPEPHVAGSRVSVIVVPVTRKPSEALDGVPGPDHGGGVYLQLGGNVERDLDLVREGGQVRFRLQADAGVLFPVPGSGLSWSATGSLGGELRITYERPTFVDQPDFDLPDGDNVDDDHDPTGVSFTLRRHVFQARAALDEVSARYDVEGAEIRVGRIPVIEKILPDGVRIGFDFGAEAYLRAAGEWGLRMRGGVGAEVTIPLDLELNLGGKKYSLLKVRVRRVHLQIVAAGRSEEDDAAGAAVRVDATADLSATLLGFLTVHAVRFGFRLLGAATREGNGNLAGVADIGWSTIWPRGVGVELRAWKVRGGGALAYDEVAKRLSGGMELAIGTLLQLKGVGLVEPTPDGSGDSWVAVATLEKPKPGGLFEISGVGFLYGARRTSDPEAFLDGLRSGALDAILFPVDPVANAGAYVATLARLFPAANDGEVVGLLAKFSAFASRVNASLGLIIDGGNTPRLYLVAQLRVVLPTEEVACVRINADGVAVWDAARDEFQLRVVLRNSRVWGGELTGEALVFRGDPDREDGRDERSTFISIGGFHPAYVVPGTAIRTPARVALLVQRGDHLRFEFKAYLAITPGAFHVGFEAVLQARFAGFGIRGRLGVDALVEGRKKIDVSLRASFELQLGSRRLCGASFEGQLTGWSPTYLTGRVCVSFLFWDWCSPRFGFQLSDGDDTTTERDARSLLLAAVGDRRNWDNGGAPGLSVRPAERPALWVSPSAPLRFAQDVAPLGHRITHFDAEALPGGGETFTIDPVRPPDAAWQVRTIDGEFAPILYFEMSREERLAARAFDVLPAGFELSRPLEAGALLEADLTYEDWLFDSANPPERPTRTHVLDEVWSGAAATLDPHRAGPHVPSPRRPPVVRGERFAVIDRDGVVIASALRFTDARGRLVGERGGTVVPGTELAS